MLGVEYELNTRSFCSQANSQKFSWLRKNLDLDAPRTACCSYLFYYCLFCYFVIHYYLNLSVIDQIVEGLTSVFLLLTDLGQIALILISSINKTIITITNNTAIIITNLITRIIILLELTCLRFPKKMKSKESIPISLRSLSALPLYSKYLYLSLFFFSFHFSFFVLCFLQFFDNNKYDLFRCMALV